MINSDINVRNFNFVRITNIMLFKKPILFLMIISGMFFLSTSSCEYDSYIYPDVSIYLNLNLSLWESKIGPGEYMFYDDEGLNGLIIFRDFNNNWSVFDRTCTYEDDYSCAVEDDTTSSFHLSCPCCGSQYFIDPTDPDGIAYVTIGPSKYNLIQYSCFTNGGTLIIRN